MQLSELYSKGTTLAEVDPWFRGMPWDEYHSRSLTAQANSPEVVAYWKQFQRNGKSPIEGKAVWTPRDSYGMKGM